MSDPELDDLGLAMPEFRVPSKGSSSTGDADQAEPARAQSPEPNSETVSSTAETVERRPVDVRTTSHETPEPHAEDADEQVSVDATASVAPEELERDLENDARASTQEEGFDRAELVKTVRMDAFDRSAVEGSPSWEINEYLEDQRYAPDVLVQPPRVLTKKWQDGARVQPNGSPTTGGTAVTNDRSAYAATVRTTIPDGSFDEEIDVDDESEDLDEVEELEELEEISEIDEIDEIDEIEDDEDAVALEDETAEESEVRPPPPRPQGEANGQNAARASDSQPEGQQEAQGQRPGRVRRNTGPLRPAQPTPVPVEEKADDDLSGIVQELLDEQKAEEQKQQAPKQRRPDDKRTNWFHDVFGEEYFRTLPEDLAKVTEREVRFMHKSLGLQKGARILDLACGFGRHAVELARRDYEVAGLDISMAMLQRALSEAQRQNLSIKFIHGDMRELNFQEIFDACINWQTSFGYFDDRTNVQVAKGIARALKPGGRLLLDVVNRDYVIGEMPSRTWWEGHECVFLEEVEFDNHTSVLHTKRSFIYEDGSPPREFSSYIRLYSLHELRQLLAFAGFRLIEVSGAVFHRGSFLGPASPRLILLAEKYNREKK
jgi:SAM-dependent methyltransferase